MNTVTVADYAVEFSIPAPAYKKWYDEVYQAEGDLDKGIPTAVSLKRHLISTFEQHMTNIKMEKKGLNTKSKNKKSLLRLNNLEEVKIFDIVFAFANEKLVEALTARGTAIGKNRFD